MTTKTILTAEAIRIAPTAVRTASIHCAALVALSIAVAAETADPPPTVSIADPTRRIDGLGDTDPRRPSVIELVAPRNGYASGAALLSGDTPDSKSVTVSALRGSTGVLPADNILIRHARRARPEPLSFKFLSDGSDTAVTVPYYDELHDTPETGSPGTFHPVWVTVHVPPDTAPGIYTGTLAASTVSVPVRLTVAPWTCPPPSHWQTHAGILSSPETIALHYEVPLWSDRHWALIERQMSFLAGLGNDDVWFSVFSRNSLGHEKSWITYTREGDHLKADLGLVRRYLTLYDRMAGRPHAVLLEIWNSVRCRARPGRPPPRSVEVWVDGKPEQAPIPGEEGSDLIWAPLLSDFTKMLSDLGWDESLLVLGCADDVRPLLKTVNAFKSWAPGSGWAFWTHGRGDPPPWDGKWIIGGMRVAHYEHLFCPWVGEDRPDGITGGWDLEAPEYATCRNYLPKYAPPSQYRSLPEGTVVQIGRTSANMTRNGAGFTRLALDFWPVRIGDDDLPHSLLLFYESAPWDIFFRNNSRSILAPGTNGPVATVRYEMLREGMQECEARIAIEQALASGRIGSALEKRCRDLLRRRLKIREANGKFRGGHAGDTLGAEENRWTVPADWQASALELYNLAAECARAMSGEKR